MARLRPDFNNNPNYMANCRGGIRVKPLTKNQWDKFVSAVNKKSINSQAMLIVAQLRDPKNRFYQSLVYWFTQNHDLTPKQHKALYRGLGGENIDVRPSLNNSIKVWAESSEELKREAYSSYLSSFHKALSDDEWDDDEFEDDDDEFEDDDDDELNRFTGAINEIFESEGGEVVSTNEEMHLDLSYILSQSKRFEKINVILPEETAYCGDDKDSLHISTKGYSISTPLSEVVKCKKAFVEVNELKSFFVDYQNLKKFYEEHKHKEVTEPKKKPGIIRRSLSFVSGAGVAGALSYFVNHL